MTHAYDTIDVRLNFKNISPLTSSTITWIYKFKFKFEYIRNEAGFANKKAYFIFLNGYLTDYQSFDIGNAIYNATYNVVQIQRLKKLLHGNLLEEKFTSVTKKLKELVGI